MKKLIFVMMAAIAFSCGDGSNRASESSGDANERDNTETVEPDTTGMTDTTSMDNSDQNRQDTTRNN